MKLKCKFVCTKVAEDIVAVPVGQRAGEMHLVLKLNEESQYMLECLSHETTEDEIVVKMIEEYDVDKITLVSSVHEFIEKLRSVDLIERDE